MQGALIRESSHPPTLSFAYSFSQFICLDGNGSRVMV